MFANRLLNVARSRLFIKMKSNDFDMMFRRDCLECKGDAMCFNLRHSMSIQTRDYYTDLACVNDKWLELFLAACVSRECLTTFCTKFNLTELFSVQFLTQRMHSESVYRGSCILSLSFVFEFFAQDANINAEI